MQLQEALAHLGQGGLSAAKEHSLHKDILYLNQLKALLLKEQTALVKQQELQLEIQLLLLQQGAVQQRSAEAVAGVPSALTAVTIDAQPSDLAVMVDWHRYAYNPAASGLEHAAYFGFRPKATLPANIAPELVSPAFGLIVEAAAGPATPPPDLGSQTDLLCAVHELLDLGSSLHRNPAELPYQFCIWHTSTLQAGLLPPPPLSTNSLNQDMNSICCDGSEFAVSLLECKSDVGSGQALVQALRRYQLHYKDGELWRNRVACRSDPLPAVVLLLEGPRLSFHAVWTLYQNRVAYAPLTPSYYLADEGRNTGTVWSLMAVLAAYKRAVEELSSLNNARANDDPGLRRAADMRTAAHMTDNSGGGMAARPCTLPYSVLDESLQLYEIAFRGQGLLYEARQRLGGQEQRVLVKFVEGRYGAEVHEAWHEAGVAPKLYDVRAVPYSSYTMVVMERLDEQEGWKPLSSVLRGGGEPLRQAVRDALRRAHAAPLPNGGRGVHGDMRGPNIMVRPLSGGSAWLVRFMLNPGAGAAAVAT
ncbi:hypothetical protein HYH03_017773 [Edaphochlamys debaryana]|uniref:Protein kinase domain-containing protein n=1 Tax=Edaphochlamys debaryana TaxID=47281 RepID=A0A836BNT1_9CHLO|nr:hypothetical protein HYH03_017773 [Edaphochlamys debaryana]|eukprot:KAG2483325.1 hypothetical protein HYH03_017773 [Edaphochlamys debaryana]